MIDQVLGFNRPVVRRKRADNTSENSNKQQVAAPVTVSPVRSGVKKLNSEESNTVNTQKQEEQKFESPAQNTSRGKVKTFASRPIEAKSEITSDERPEPRIQRKKQSKSEVKTESEQEMASPAVKNLKVARFAKTADEMKASGKMKQSIRTIQVQDNSTDTMYKLKLLAFIVVSIFLILHAMTPSRKCTYRRK